MRQVYGSREPRSAFLHCTPCLSGTSELPTSPSPHQCGGEGRQAGMTEGRNQGGSKPGLPFRFKPSKPHPGVRQGPGSPQGARSRVLGGVSKSTAPWSHLGLLTCKTQRSHGRGPDRAVPLWVPTCLLSSASSCWLLPPQAIFFDPANGRAAVGLSSSPPTGGLSALCISVPRTTAKGGRRRSSGWRVC